MTGILWYASDLDSKIDFKKGNINKITFYYWRTESKREARAILFPKGKERSSSVCTVHSILSFI